MLLGILRVLCRGFDGAVSYFGGNHGFEWELGLLGVPRVFYEQLVILVGIGDFIGI